MEYAVAYGLSRFTGHTKRRPKVSVSVRNASVGVMRIAGAKTKVTGNHNSNNLVLLVLLYRNRRTTFAYHDDGGCAPLRVVDGAASEMR